MIDAKRLRQDYEEVRAALARRHAEIPERFLQIEQERKDLQVHVQDLQNQRNILAKEIGQAKAKQQPIEALLAQAQTVASALEGEEKRLTVLLQEQQSILDRLPNLPDADVPFGHGEEDNVVVETVGTPRPHDPTLLDHVAMGMRHGVLSTEMGAMLSGARFYVLQGNVAKLHRALAQWMLSLHTEEHGYTECYVPYLVSDACLYGTGQFPKFKEDVFSIEGDKKLHLIPTSEVPLTNMAREQIVDWQSLPLRWTAHSPCFRSEVGSYGKDVFGMFRVHQFDKVEMVQIVHPEHSEQAHQEMVRHARNVLEGLELPYRVMHLCTGDMGATACSTYDLEVWLPSEGRYREISSVSNTRDYQARRMQARFKDVHGKTRYVHTLNGSGVAVGRALIALLENHQDAQGRIYLPPVLRPWFAGRSHLDPVS